MEYRKLNLIDGPDQDLHDFMRLLNAALEAGHTKVNMELLAPMTAAGMTQALVAVAPDGAVVGLQVWDIGQPWNFDTVFCIMRVNFFESEHDTPVNKAQFMQQGTTQLRVEHGSATFVAAQRHAPEFDYLLNCGLTPLVTIHVIP